MRIIAVGDMQVRTLDQFEAAVRKIDLERGLPLVVETVDGRIGNILIGGDPAPKQP